MKLYFLLFLVPVWCIMNATDKIEYRPVVLMHGLLGDAGVMVQTEQWLKDAFPGIYVLNVDTHILPGLVAAHIRAHGVLEASHGDCEAPPWSILGRQRAVRV